MDSIQVQSQFRYEYLPRGSIRLLRLLPDEDENGPIRCRFITMALSDFGSTRPYEALSYVWGSDKDPRTVELMNQRIGIGQNLHSAMLHLRDRCLERIIWIDALCINQEDNDEKSIQIQAMAKIYTKAIRVIVWLGEATKESDRALEDLRRAGQSQLGQSWTNIYDTKAILEILRRPWFERIWVVQEIAAARNVLIKCGSTEIDGPVLASGLHVLGLPDNTCPELQSLVLPLSSLMRDSMYRPKHTVFDPARFSLDIRPLSELVDVYRARKATKLHDKIYALLGMSSNHIATELLPDYKKPWSVLLRQAVQMFVSEHLSVKTWDDREVVLIEGNGYPIGKISHVERHDVGSDETTISWDGGFKALNLVPTISKWRLQGYANAFQIGDVVCLLQGSKHLTMIRAQDDHWAVIAIAISPQEIYPSHGGILLADVKWLEIYQSLIGSPHLLSMAWNWGHLSANNQDKIFDDFMTSGDLLQYAEQASVHRAMRFYRAGSTFLEVGVYDEAERKIQNAIEIYELIRKDMERRGEDFQEDLWLPRRNFLSCPQCPEKFNHTGIMSLLVAARLGLEKMMTWLLLPNMNDLNQSISKESVSQAEKCGHDINTQELPHLSLAQIRTRDREEATLLHLAAINGHEAVVRLLLRAPGVKPDDRGRFQRTPLHLAAKGGHEAVVRLLLSAPGVKPHDWDQHQRTPLHLAAKEGHEAVVQLLLGTPGVNLNDRDRRQRTPLHLTAKSGHEAVIRLLLDMPGVEHDARDQHQLTPLHLASVYEHEAVVRLLLDMPEVEPDARDKSQRTPLHLAAESGREAVVRFLSGMPGVEPDSRDKYQRTPLHLAAESGHEAVVRILLDTPGVKSDARDKYQRTPLHLAANSGRGAVVRLLPGMPGVEPDARDKYQRTPLHLAAESGREAVVRILLDMPGVEHDARDKYQRTLLHLAAESGHAAVVRLLLDMPGVEYDARDKYQRTPLHLAVDGGHKAVVQLLQGSRSTSFSSEITTEMG